MAARLTPDRAPLGGVGTPQKPFGFYDATVDGGWQVPDEPYVRTTEDPAASTRRSNCSQASHLLGAYS